MENPTVTLRRLFSRALITPHESVLRFQRVFGTRIDCEPLRNWPVNDFGLANTSATVPAATTCPPRKPA